MNKPLLASLLIAPALVVAQSAPAAPPAQSGQSQVPGPRPAGPGTPERNGQTIQIGEPPADAGTGGLIPSDIWKPLAEEWRSYSGDLSGKRYSSLKHVNTSTVKNLSLKWITQLNTGCGPTGTGAPTAGGGGGGRGGGGGGGR